MILLDRFLPVALLVLAGTAFAEVKEVKTMAEALKGLDASALVVFDIDNTLVEPDQMLGSDQWYDYFFDRIQKQEKLTDDAAEAVTGRVWGILQQITTVHPPEAATPELILQLKHKHVPVMALTARPADLMDVTLKQLASVGVTFDDGRVLFANGKNKGNVLLEAMTQFNLKPTKVIFVDDKKKNCDNVDKALTEAKIPVTAFRYGAADKTVKAFDPNVADIQYFYAQRLLSNEEAATLKKAFGTKKKVQWSHLERWRAVQ